MSVLDDATLHDAFVSRDALFEQAARALMRTPLDAIAVLDDERRVVGLFTHDDLLRGIFPGYLRELRHTAFLTGAGDEDALDRHFVEPPREPVERTMHEPVVVERDSAAVHVAERFLHCDWGALAVVDRGRFAGMLDQGEFCRVVLDRLGRTEHGRGA